MSLTFFSRCGLFAYSRDAQYGGGLAGIPGDVSPMSGPCSIAIAGADSVVVVDSVVVGGEVGKAGEAGGSVVSGFCSQLVRTTKAEQTSSLPKMASVFFMGV